MKVKIITFLSSLVLISCIQDEPLVVLINESGEQYDSAQVFSTPNLPTTFNMLTTDDRRKGVILFDKTIQSDGTYGIKLYKGSEVVRSRYFGYYTNGGSLNKNFKITIERDTIIVEY